ncbi:MAG: hypothetical protein P4L72_09065 [Parvibaculum sp.]|uniref:hypothetical protein n=1 Tax=Parvibaculum sp. TaxID=2024848 RepID=UPI00283FB858|nr:hypothetical protein [Parvibaculum sp.]MDR3499363.1 hypothetical protein [Parvibaculum sp.]
MRGIGNLFRNGWRSFLFALAGLNLAVFTHQAFFRPASFELLPYAMQNDARQFQSWMPRLLDPTLLNGDLIADYWHAMSPLLYRAVFAVPAFFGLDPIFIGKILPIALVLATAAIAWKIALKLDARPAAAFVISALTTAVVIYQTDIFSPTPRGFAAPLLLLFFAGLLYENMLLAIVALASLAAVYPAPALPALTILGLWHLRWQRPFHLEISRRSFLTMAAAVVAVGLAALPFRLATAEWGPTVQWADAITQPNFMVPWGKSSIVQPDGSFGWLCSQRLGFLPRFIDCEVGGGFGRALNLLLTLVPGTYLFLRAVRRIRRGEAASSGELIYGYTLLASAIWFVIAASVAFDLHLPSRYSQKILVLTGALATGQLAGGFIADWLGKFREAGQTFLHDAAVTLVALLSIAVFSLSPPLWRPQDLGAIRQIAALPPQSLIAGASGVLDYVPALTGRKVFATVKHAIPYQLGYFRVIRERLLISARIVVTPDGKELKSLLEKNGITTLVVNRSILMGGPLPADFQSILGDATPHNDEWWSIPALSGFAESCATYSGRTVVILDAACIEANIAK